MKAPTRLLLFVLLPLGVAVGGVASVLQRRARSPAQARQRPLPASTQVVSGRTGLEWNQPSMTHPSAFGFIDAGAWYASSFDRGMDSDLMIGDVKGGRIAIGTKLRAAPNGPGVAADGLLFLPTAAGDVTAIDLMTCRPTWVAPAGAPVARVALDGGRVVARGKDRVTCFDAATGRTLWAATASNITAGPGIAGRYACFATPDALHVLDAATGRQLRTVAAAGMWDQIAIDGDRAYACARPTMDGKVGLYAVDLARGSVAWQFSERAPGPPPLLTSIVNVRGPTIGEGVVVFAFEHTLYALDAATGKRRWLWQATLDDDGEEVRRALPGRASPPDPLVQTPAVRNGVVYATWADVRVSGWDVATGREVWRCDASNPEFRLNTYRALVHSFPSNPPPVSGDGLLLCATGYGLVAVSCDLVPKAPSSTVTPASRTFSLPAAVGIASTALLVAIILGVFGLWRLMTAAICLVLCSLTIWAWVRSYGASDFVGYDATTRTSPFVARSRKGVTSLDGSLAFGHWRQVSQTFTRRSALGGKTPEWRWEREPSAISADLTRNGLRRFAWTRRTRSSGVTNSPQAETSLTLPHWFVAAVLGIAPMAWLTGLWRDRRRHPRGHCENCGYDVRGIAGRCPECGWDLPVDQPKPKRRGLPSTR